LASFALALALLWLVVRHRRRQSRTSELESAVAQRTQDLRREIEQRAELETRAAQLREELRLANRLATLGQVSANVAHETAQPVAAIRNYAAAAQRLLDHAEVEETRANLAAIDRLAQRIGVVTAQLRGFARKKASGRTTARLADVFEGTQILLRDRLHAAETRFPTLPDDLTVTGDTVRIEQILVNLLQNALDALDGQAGARIAITARIDTREGTVTLTVSDNGPGIAPAIAERLFTPFTTSRAEGLGLGLVIAQDIAAEFGGSLRYLGPDAPEGAGQGAPEGAGQDARGACFELVLRIAA
ncbi:ATP-binding protein, partial [Novosphingobium sp. 1949]